MISRKVAGSFALIILIGVGTLLLTRASSIAPETAGRVRALAQLASVGEKPSLASSNKDSAPTSGMVSPAEISLDNLPDNFVQGPSKYEKWLAGLIDLENEGLRTKAELDEMRNQSISLAPDPNIQSITASPSRAPVVLTGFASLDSTECCGGGITTPPDPELAVGPDHIIAVVNVTFEIYDKSGTTLVAPTTFDQFFAALGGSNCTAGGPFDPNVVYDESWDRFIMATDGNGAAYCVGVTKTADPTGAWWLYEFPTNVSNLFFDFPHAGVGLDALYMGGNMFLGLDFVEGRVWAFDKAAMYDGLPAAYVTHSTGDDDTPNPLHLHGYNYGAWPGEGPHYFLATRNYNGYTYQLYAWEDPFGLDLFTSENTLDFKAYHQVAVGLPMDAPQAGGQSVQANDFRPLDFEYQDGNGWTTMTVACNPGGGSVDCVQWAQIDLASASVVQAGVFASTGTYRFFPDIAANFCGDAAVGYTHSSSSTFYSVYATGRAASDPPGTMQAETLLKAGEISYRGFDTIPYRWGDYTEMALDPDGLTFWYLGEYSKITGTNTRWGTYISSMQFGDCTLPSDFTLDVVPKNLQVCTNDQAAFEVAIGSMSGYSDLVTLDLVGADGSEPWSFTPNPILPPANSLLAVPTAELGAGTYSLDIIGAGPTTTHTATVSMDVVNPLSTGPVLSTPVNGASNVNTSPLFAWGSLPDAVSYELQISTSPDFSTLLYTTSLQTTNHSPNISLTPDTLYFWRVRGHNACGDGAFSSTGYFITAVQVCQDVNQSIPDNGSLVKTLVSSSGGVIQDLDVMIQATHSFVGDLSFTLKHLASGTTVTLVDRPGVPTTTYGCSGNDVNVTLDDEGTSPVENACASPAPAVAGRLIPQQSLALFDGKALAGSWSLTAQDNAASDTGTLVRWCLQPSLGPAAIEVDPLTIESTVPVDEPLTDTLQITNTGASALHWFTTESADGCLTETDLPWFETQATTGKIQPGTSGILGYTLDSSALSAGATASGYLCLQNNSLAAPQVTIPITISTGAQVYISPSLTTISMERPFTVTIMVTGTAAFTSADVTLAYNPAALEFLQAAPGACLDPDQSLTVISQPLAGSLRYQGTGSLPCSGGEIAQVSFRGLVPGEAPLTLVTGTLTTTQGLPAGPFSLLNGSVQLLPNGTLTGSVQAQGQLSREPDAVQADFSGALVSAWDGVIGVMTATIDSTGGYTLSLPAGIYTVTVEVPRYLDALTQTITILSGQVTPLPVVLLLGGDANDSDTINIFDLSILSSQYGSIPSTPGWDERGDINHDLVIDIRDIAIAAGNYGKNSIVDIPWH